QCGFCTPGIAIAAAGLLARNADPSEEEIKQAIPNLCRCGVYSRLVRAIQRAGRVARRAGRIVAAPACGIAPADAAAARPAMRAREEKEDESDELAQPQRRYLAQGAGAVAGAGRWRARSSRGPEGPALARQAGAALSRRR